MILSFISKDLLLLILFLYLLFSYGLLFKFYILIVFNVSLLPVGLYDGYYNPLALTDTLSRLQVLL